MSGSDNHKGSADGVRPPADPSDGRRLPPPAFPPGVRRVAVRRRAERAPRMDDAFISPDDPIPESAGFPADAFISPDDPFARAGGGGAFISPDEPIPHVRPQGSGPADEALDTDDVVVTGIGDDPHLDPKEFAIAGDPHVAELVQQVVKLAESLRHRGEAGLRTTPEMTRFEATLRSYCVGYLAGRRAEDEDF